MQLWPANEKAFAASRVAASSRSASAATITGVAFPSSSLTRFRGARSRSFQPTSAGARERDQLRRARPRRARRRSRTPGRTTTFNQPAGSPASVSSSARRSAESGVCDAGFSTTAQPAASAGATLCATRLNGKLNGEIAPTTPIGTRRRERELPVARRGGVHRHDLAGELARLDGGHRERRHRARRLDARRLHRLARLRRDRLRDLLVRARSSEPATRSRISARLCAGSGSAIACSAASTARRVSSAPPFATRPTTRAEYGERTSIQSPVSTHSPRDEELPLDRGRRHGVSVSLRSVRPRRPLRDVRRRRIAYQVVGDGAARHRVRLRLGLGPRPAGWEDAFVARSYEARLVLALILFDKRGSRPVRPRRATSPTLEARMDDVRAVLDAVGCERAALSATHEGGADVPCSSLPPTPSEPRARAVGTYARRPLGDGLPVGATRGRTSGGARGDRGAVGQIRCELDVARARRLADDERFIDLVVRLPAMSASPGAARGAHADERPDRCSRRPPADRRPTLVLHRTGPSLPSRVLATSRDGSRVRDSSNCPASTTSVRRRPGRDARRDRGVPHGVLAGSRRRPSARDGPVHRHRRLDRAGGRARRPRLARPARQPPRARAAGARNGFAGPRSTTAGDGFLATFDGPARAIRCACAIRDAVAGSGLEIRAGVHTGECEVRGDTIAGIAVHIGARVAALGRAWRGARVEHREGSRRGLGDRVRGARRARAEGRSGTVAALCCRRCLRRTSSTPFGRRSDGENGSLVRDPGGRARGAGPERARRACRHRSRRDRGRPDGLRDAGRRAGAERRARGRPRRGLAGDGVRDDRRPAVRLVDADGVQRRRRGAGGPSRPRRRRRRRAHVARADGLQPRRRGLGCREREDRRALADRPAGHLRRGDRGGVGSLPRVARRVLARVAPRGRSPPTDEGRFENEIVPIEVGAGGAVVLFAVDETPRRDTSLEKLAALQPAFKADGVVTAGNSSSIVDGAAAMLSRARRRSSGTASSRARASSRSGSPGVDPYRMLHGNPEACERALAKAGLAWADISVIEVNEAFASVVLQFLADTGLHGRWEDGDVNPNGGGISLGHPLGATGARITATLAQRARASRRALRDRDDVHRPGPGDRRRPRTPLAPSARLIDIAIARTGADRHARASFGHVRTRPHRRSSCSRRRWRTPSASTRVSTTSRAGATSTAEKLRLHG